MMQKAEQAGLRLMPADRASYREHANIDEQLYDPRDGPGIFYRCGSRVIPAGSARKTE
jgi:hypothetical protein